MRRFVPLLLIVLTACQASTATLDAPSLTPSATEAVEVAAMDAPIATNTPAVGSHQATRNAINAENTAIAATNWEAWHTTYTPTVTPTRTPAPTVFRLQIGDYQVTPDEIEFIEGWGAFSGGPQMSDHWRIILSDYTPAPSDYAELVISPTQVKSNVDTEHYLASIEEFQDYLKERPTNPIYSYPPDPAQRYHFGIDPIAQAIYLDSQNGSGVRFVAHLKPDYNEPNPIVDSWTLRYIYIGLTADEQYVIAVDFPLSHPNIPDTWDDVPTYTDLDEFLQSQIAIIETAAPSDFTPSLADLDALVQSIEVK